MRVIDKEVYAAIERVSQREGGLSGGRRFENMFSRLNPGRPCCAIGAAQVEGLLPMDRDLRDGDNIYSLAEDLNLRDGEFDYAYDALIEERGLKPYDRIPFADIAARAGWSASI
jgi:hypothetical protein